MLQVELHPFPEMTTSRLRLRQITEKDVHDFYLLRSNDDVMKYIDIPKLASVDAAAELIKKITGLYNNKESITWGITFKDRDELIGTVLYKSIDYRNHRAEVGYLLSPSHWRKGILQEALTAVLHHGFSVFNFHSIEALVNPGNVASISLLEKNKFVKEAHFRENYYFDGKFLDTAVYSLLATDFPAPPV